MGFIFFIGIIAVFIYFAAKSNKASREKWQTAADILKLNFSPGGLGTAGTITGLMGTHRVVVTTVTKGSGSSSQAYTRYDVQYRTAIPVNFQISREGAMQKIGKAFGKKDIETGNPDFDDRVMVTGGPPSEVLRFLTPERQKQIGYLVATYSDVSITNRKITVNKLGKDADPSVIVHCVRRLVGFADELTGKPQGASAPVKPEPVSPVPEKAEADFLEIEAFEPPLDQFATPNPIVPDPAEWTDLEEEATPETETEPIVAVDEPPVVEESEPEPAEPLEPVAPEPAVVKDEVVATPVVQLQQVAGNIYGGDAGTSPEVEKLFTDKYKNGPVEGVGTLRKVSKISYNPVFTNSTGILATFDVCELAGTYSRIKVQAVVRYDESEFDELKSKIGSIAPIIGKLIGQDGLMRHLFIEAEG